MWGRKWSKKKKNRERDGSDQVEEGKEKWVGMELSGGWECERNIIHDQGMEDEDDGQLPEGILRKILDR